MPRAPRTSCDRCHAQKLKCQKQYGTSVCSRCMKASVTCNFSTPGRGIVRQTSAAATPAADLVHVQQSDPPAAVALQDIQMQFDWPPMTLDPTWEPLPEFTPEFPTGPDSATSVSEPTEPPEAPEDLRSSIARRLSELATEFDHLYSNAAAEELRHLPNDESIREIATKWGKEHNQQKVLEQLFASTQQLIGIYPEAVGQIFRERHKVDCQDPGCIHHEPLPAELAGALQPVEDDSMEREDIDHFLSDHLLLCHSRLNDLLGTLLLRLKMCSLIRARNPVLEESDFDVPTLTVGNVVVSAHSATSMQALLLVHIATSLVSRAQLLRNKMNLAIHRQATGTTMSSKSRLLGLRCDVLVEESESRLKLLKIARDHLLETRFEQ
ncbi:hypothetical protein PG996_006471 [Apiospora saccharicola]|uniref:Zn(2)-C6 fungal-type domain-containing protein n=1 Tax=Apiospora saccharicola TaxID=335842 RepID=A0ABR1VPF3_9PEZI